MKKLIFLISTKGKTSKQVAQEAWSSVQNYRQVKADHKALADYTVKEMGENLRRNVEAERNDPNYKAPI